MPVEAPESLSSSLKHCEVLNQPNPGGWVEPNEQLNGYQVKAQFPDRILAPERPQRVEISPYLPESPLEEMGFLMNRQIKSLINLINKGIDEGKSLQEAVAAAVEEPIKNVRHYANEYTRERPLLKGEVKRDNRLRNIYNSEPLTDHLDWQEREGATALGNLNLEKEVLIAGQGESVVQISPPGWNGVYEDYEKAQLIYFRIKDAETGELEQLTFVVNCSVEDCIDLLARLGVNRADLVCVDRKETIKAVATQAVRLNPGKNQIAGPKDFLNLVKRNKLNDPVMAVIERDLDRLDQREDISILAPVCEGYMESLRRFILENAERLYNLAFQVEVSNAIEKTIYEIAKYIRGFGERRGSGSLTLVADSVWSDSWRDAYRGEIEVLREIKGCAGGGRSSTRIMSGNISGVLSGSSYASFETDEYGSLEFECGECSRTNRRPRGKLLSKCQHCGASTNC